MPGFYNHNYHILQTPDYVVLVVEMIHDARIIPLDGRPGMSRHIRQWMGDSRGRWEGDTLVIETTRFNDKILRRGGTVLGGNPSMRVVERLTRVDADTIDYQVTVTDPTIWTAPWTRLDSDEQTERGHAVRICVPRGQLRPDEYPDRGARAGVTRPCGGQASRYGSTMNVTSWTVSSPPSWASARST